jgi:putative mRNA 3-end processing factor
MVEVGVSADAVAALMRCGMSVLELRADGLYCPGGGFYVDPWGAVDRAVISHAHADRAWPGSRAYLTAASGAALLRDRLGPDAAIQTLAYGERLAMGDTAVSLHPAGHLPGSAQVRIEHAGEVWVVSGDYKLAPDPTCEAFELLRCHTFVTGAAFALPVFRWPAPADAIAGIHDWWRANQDAGKASVLYVHPLGMAQRILASLDGSIGPIGLHPEVERYCSIYRAQGIDLPHAAPGATLTLAPAGWKAASGRVSTAMASGWMRIRGTRRRRSLDRGFVLSNHADWGEVLGAIDGTGAETVWVTHGYRAPLARWLEEHGRRVQAVEARYEEAE